MVAATVPTKVKTETETMGKEMGAVVKPESIAPSEGSPDFQLLLKNFQSSTTTLSEHTS